MLLAENRYEHILKKNTSGPDLMDWYEGELARLHEQLQSNLGSVKEEFYRQELASFRSIFHKPVIYSNWDWSTTVQDALHQAGFSSFEEQVKALEVQRSNIW
jgi:pyruvate,water dikinase